MTETEKCQLDEPSISTSADQELADHHAGRQAQLSEFEELFKDRYTENDEEYIKTKDTPLPPPPCVQDWYSRPKRNYDWSRGQNRDGSPGYSGSYQHRNQGHSGGQGQRNWHRDRDQGYQQDHRKWNRDQGQGSYGQRNHGNRDYNNDRQGYRDQGNKGYNNDRQGYRDQGNRNNYNNDNRQHRGGYNERNQGYGNRESGYNRDNRYNDRDRTTYPGAKRPYDQYNRNSHGNDQQQRRT